MSYEAPIGNNKPFLVKMNGNPFAGFDTRTEADAYVQMMLTCKKGGKKVSKKEANSEANNKSAAFCALQSWSIEAR